MFQTAIIVFALAAPADAQPASHPETAKALIAQLAGGQFDKAVEPFSQILKKALPAEKLQAVWSGVTEQYGPLVRATETREIRGKRYDFVFVTCEFQRAKLAAKVVFESGGKIDGLFFVPAGRYKPPAYDDPSKYDEKPIEIGQGIWSLPGTLSLPRGDGPFPAVVLVHGSGPQDRDETIGPNKPLRDLAHGLASRGIAVLRYEKRTKQHPNLSAFIIGSLTVKEETIDDAVSAVEALASQSKIDPKRIFVLGHSLGGTVLPRIGKAEPRIAGFISLAGSTRPLEDIILDQVQYVMSLSGKEASAKEQKQLKELEQQVAKAKSPTLSEKTPRSELPLGIPARYWLDLRDYDPAKAAADLHKPMLFLQGERDYQVTMEDFAGWKRAVGSRKDVRFIAYPALNHLFIAGRGKSTPAEYTSAGNVSQTVVDDIARWINAQGAPDR